MVVEVVGRLEEVEGEEGVDGGRRGSGVGVAGGEGQAGAGAGGGGSGAYDASRDPRLRR